MRNVLLVAGQELLVNLRRPAFILLTLLVPILGLLGVLMVALFSGPIGGMMRASDGGAASKPIGYVDQSGLLAGELAQHAGKYVQYPDSNSALRMMLEGQVDRYFVLPADYLETGRVAVHGVELGLTAFASIDEEGLRRFLIDHLLAGKVDGATLERVQSPARVEWVSVDREGRQNEESPLSLLGDFIVPYLFALVLVVSLFTASGYLLQGVAEEKEGRIIELLVSSISPTELLAGKIVGLGVLGLIQMAFWAATGGGVAGVAAAVLSVAGFVELSAGTLLLGAVYFLLGYLLFATLMATAGSLGATARESQQIAGLFSLSAAVPWLFAGVVVTNANSVVAVVLSYVPLTAPVMMLLRLGFGDVPAREVALSLALLVAGIAVSMWAGAKVFRVALLMYGKRPGLRDLARAFREA